MISIQPELCQALPTVYGQKDYQEFRAALIEMDRILKTSGAEDRIIIEMIEAKGTNLSLRKKQRRYKTYWSALRYNILIALTGYSYRKLAIRMPDSHLFQWFTRAAQIDAVRPASKSTIERFEKMIPSKAVTQLVTDLNRAVAEKESCQTLLYREAALKMDKVFADTSCVETNIHFPVDWVLLRDATRTLIKAIIIIRKHGLKHRISEPKSFIRKMNKCCIEMTHVRNKRDAGKKRRVIFRRMKQLMKVVVGHAENYRELLQEYWEETGLSPAETQNILDRIDGILHQLPQAISQAHERIIGKRKVANKDKILSFYEPDTRVIVRGKAGAEVEFGNALYLAEQADGLIIDWQLLQSQPPSDNKLVELSLDRIENVYGSIESYSADRGFDSSAVKTQLKGHNIINGICPRSVNELKEQLEDENFCALQKRRSQTEGRIGIFKNAYLGKPLRSKGFPNRKIRIDWCVLAHNLWKLANIAAQKRRLVKAA